MLWIRNQIVQKIESEFRNSVGGGKLNYFIFSCPGKTESDPCVGNHKLVWYGPCGITRFIKKVKNRNFDASLLYVTSIQSKSATKRMLECSDDIPEQIYWIGDCARAVHPKIMCCDDMIEYLWRLIKP